MGRLYESLKKQTICGFEWLIVDDGSTDGTEQLIAQFKANDDTFPIAYHRKQNDGKHTAHNLALSLAKGEYFAIIDSDDWYVPEALERLKWHWDQLGTKRDGYANVEGLCVDERGDPIGSPFPKDVFDSDNFQILFQRKHTGDTKGMYRLEALREYPFPEGLEGQFVSEAMVWNRIADRYATRFINEVIGCNEYLPGGLTKRSRKQRLKDSHLSVVYFREILESKKTIPWLTRIKFVANYARYSLHAHVSMTRQFRDAPDKILYLMTFAVGCMAYIIDIAKVLGAKEGGNAQLSRKIGRAT